MKNSKGKFNQVSTDLALEQSANRDAETAGGIIGLTHKESTLIRHYSTLAQRASVVSSVKAMTHVGSKMSSCHRELRKSHTDRDVSEAENLYNAMGDMINPYDIDFQTESCAPLVNIVTGDIVSDDISHELLHVKELGFDMLDTYLKGGSRKMKHHKLKTFSDYNTKKASKSEVQTKDLLEEIGCFRKLTLMQGNKGTKIDFIEVLSYEITSMPGSLADKKDGAMRHGNKAELLGIFRDEIGRKEWISTISGEEVDTCIVYDAMAHVHSCGKLKNEKYTELSERYLIKILAQCKRMDNVNSIHWVCDRYDQKYSTKELEHKRRGQQTSNFVGHQVSGNITVPQWEELMSRPANKANLLQFIYEDWCQKVKKLLPSKLKLFIGGGFKERSRSVMVTNCKVQKVPQLQSEQEEADTRIILHVQYAAITGSKRIIVRASDIDVVTLCIHYFSKIKGISELWIWKSESEFIPVHQIVSAMGPKSVNTMMAFHAITGCDTTSRFYRKGKKTAFRSLKSNLPKTEGLCEIGTIVEDEIIPKRGYYAAKQLVLGMYSGGQSFANLNELSAHLYCSKDVKDLSVLPPTEDAFRHHMLRVQFQVIVWKTALETFPLIPSPLDYGWKESEEGSLLPIYISSPNLPPDMKKKASCHCTKGQCTKRCPCDKAGPCTVACLCRGNPEFCDRAKEIDETESKSDSDSDSD